MHIMFVDPSSVDHGEVSRSTASREGERARCPVYPSSSGVASSSSCGPTEEICPHPPKCARFRWDEGR